MEHLGRLEPNGLDSVEQPLPGPEQDGNHVEREFVEHSGGERLTDGRGAACDVIAILAGRLTRLGVCGLEALGDEEFGDGEITGALQSLIAKAEVAKFTLSAWPGEEIGLWN